MAVSLPLVNSPRRCTSLSFPSSFSVFLPNSIFSLSASLPLQETQPNSSPSFDPRTGVSVYKPNSYEVLVTDAAKCLAYALDDGKTRLEIDFPPLPSNFSSYKGSSGEVIDANIQLALAVIRKLQERKQTRVCIVFPDKPEKRKALNFLKQLLTRWASLDDVSSGSNLYRTL